MSSKPDPIMAIARPTLDVKLFSPSLNLAARLVVAQSAHPGDFIEVGRGRPLLSKKRCEQLPHKGEGKAKNQRRRTRRPH